MLINFSVLKFPNNNNNIDNNNDNNNVNNINDNNNNNSDNNNSNTNNNNIGIQQGIAVSHGQVELFSLG